MSRKGKKCIRVPFNKENVEFLNAKKLQEKENKTQSHLKGNKSNKEIKSSNSQRCRGDGTSSVTEESAITEVITTDDSNEVENLPEESNLSETEQAHKCDDKTKALPKANKQVIIVSSDNDKVVGVETKVLESNITTLLQNISNDLQETTISSNEPNTVRASEDTTIEAQSSDIDTDMEAIRKEVQVSKPHPDNPAWILSRTCSPPAAGHPFSSLNPNAMEFRPGGFAQSTSRRCEVCSLDITTSKYPGHLRSLQHREKCCMSQEEGIQFVKTSFRSRLATYRINGSEDSTNVKRFLGHLKAKIVKLVEDNVHIHQNIKIGMELFGRFLLQTKETAEVKSFNSRLQIASGNTDLEELFEQFATILDKKASEFAEKDSDNLKRESTKNTDIAPGIPKGTTNLSAHHGPQSVNIPITDAPFVAHAANHGPQSMNLPTTSAPFFTQPVDHGPQSINLPTTNAPFLTQPIHHGPQSINLPTTNAPFGTQPAHDPQSMNLPSTIASFVTQPAHHGPQSINLITANAPFVTRPVHHEPQSINLPTANAPFVTQPAHHEPQSMNLPTTNVPFATQPVDHGPQSTNLPTTNASFITQPVHHGPQSMNLPTINTPFGNRPTHLGPQRMNLPTTNTPFDTQPAQHGPQSMNLPTTNASFVTQTFQGLVQHCRPSGSLKTTTENITEALPTCDIIIPDHKNSTGSWNEDITKRINMQISARNEWDDPGTNYIPNVETSSQKISDINSEMSPQPSSENISTEDRNIIREDSTSNWSSEEYGEPSYPTRNERQGWNSSGNQRDYYDRNEDKSRNYRGNQHRGGRNDRRGGGKRFSNNREHGSHGDYRSSRGRINSKSPFHNSGYQANEDSRQNLSENSKELRETTESNDNYNRENRRADSSFDNSRNTSNYASKRGTNRCGNPNRYWDKSNTPNDDLRKNYGKPDENWGQADIARDDSRKKFDNRHENSGQTDVVRDDSRRMDSNREDSLEKPDIHNDDRKRADTYNDNADRNFGDKESWAPGHSKPFRRDQNMEPFGKRHDSSYKNKDRRQHSSEDSEYSSRNQSDDGKNWRDDSNRHFDRRNNNYRGNNYRGHNRSHNFPPNKQRYDNNRVRDNSGSSKDRGDNPEYNSNFGRGRNNPRAKYNPNQSRDNNYDSYENKENPDEAIEIINDESSKDSSDNYHIPDESSTEMPENVELNETIPEKTLDKSDMSQGTDVGWDGDWNTSVDDFNEVMMEKSNWDSPKEIESVEQKNQGSDMPQNADQNTLEEDKVNTNISKFSSRTSEKQPESEKPRRSFEVPKWRDRRMERENERLNKSDNMSDRGSDYSNTSVASSEQRLKQTRITSYMDAGTDKEKSDHEYDRWDMNWAKIKDFRVVREIQGNLFEQPKGFSLAHCVAEDLRMGSGIAVEFKREFKNLPDLLDQRAKQGGLATLHDTENNRFVYYLVTKRESSGKPTYITLWKSLNRMRAHIKKYEVKKLAIPRLACGLDRLEWNKVKSMLEHLFKDVDIDITVCNFQQNYGQTKKKLQTKASEGDGKNKKSKKSSKR